MSVSQADHEAALVTLRDELTASHQTSMDDHVANVQSEMDSKDAQISTLQSEIETLNTDHESALEKVRTEEKKKRDDLTAAHAEEIAALQGLPAPDSVETEALQIALVYFGEKVATIDAAIAGLPEPQRSVAAIRWGNLSGGIRRDHEFVALVTAALRWTEEKIDALFALGRKLQADKDYQPVAEDLAVG